MLELDSAVASSWRGHQQNAEIKKEIEPAKPENVSIQA